MHHLKGLKRTELHEETLVYLTSVSCTIQLSLLQLTGNHRQNQRIWLCDDCDDFNCLWNDQVLSIKALIRVTFCRSYALYLAFVLKVLFENVKYRLLLSSSICCFFKYLENPACSMK